MPLSTLFGAKDPARRRVGAVGLGWFLGYAACLIIERFVSHDRVRFARDLEEGIMVLAVLIFLYVFLAVLERDKSGNELSITNTGSGLEGH